MNNIQILQAVRLQEERLNRLRQQREYCNVTTTKSKGVLKKMLDILDTEYSNFILKHEELVASIEPEDRVHYDYFTGKMLERYEDMYLNLFADIEEACFEVTAVSETQQTQPMNENRDVLQLLETIQKKSHAKLPPLNLPHFSGKYTEWNAFHDQFCAAVHNISDIPLVQKMQHLLTFVDEPAKGIIKHLPITDLSYLPAWELLKKRFENKRAIFMNAMAQLLSVKRKRKETVAVLQNLSSVLNETIQSFKNVNVDIEFSDPIIAYLIIEKLPLETRRDFEKDAVRIENLPTVNDVNERIQKSLRTLELLESSQTSKHDSMYSSTDSLYSEEDDDMNPENNWVTNSDPQNDVEAIT